MIDIALSNIVYNSFFASTSGMNLRPGHMSMEDCSAQKRVMGRPWFRKLQSISRFKPVFLAINFKKYQQFNQLRERCKGRPRYCQHLCWLSRKKTSFAERYYHESGFTDRSSEAFNWLPDSSLCRPVVQGCAFFCALFCDPGIDLRHPEVHTRWDANAECRRNVWVGKCETENRLTANAREKMDKWNVKFESKFLCKV